MEIATPAAAPHPPSPLPRLAALAALAAASVFAALSLGSVALDWAAVWDAGSVSHGVLFELRLPRALAAFAVGALLGLAGALMQVLLRNPLADPYVLGVSGGAAAAALLALLLGASALWLNGAALAGALASVALVFALGAPDRSATQSRLLLTGVMLAAGWGALIALLLALASEAQLRGMVFWLLGDLSAAGWPALAWAVLLCALPPVLARARELNVLAQGELPARALGVPVQRLRRLLYVLASFCAAAAVTTAGTIGFIGLLAPHLTRLALGNDQRLVLPGAALAGGTLLTFADTAARTVLAPTQLPVGALTALLGVPLFLYLLSRR
jgi:iron complex transport system permease protein